MKRIVYAGTGREGNDKCKAIQGQNHEFVPLRRWSMSKLCVWHSHGSHHWQRRPTENLQLEPDSKVPNDYKSVLNGKDPQLERAVKEMLEEIKKTKKI